MNDVAHAWRPAQIHGHRRPIRTTPTSARPEPRRAGSTRAPTGWLVCCTSGDAGGEDPDADPLELAALREREQRAAADVIGYAGVTFLHHARRRARQRPRAARAARPRDPDLPAGRRARDRPVGRSSTATAGSTTPTTARPAWRRSTRSTRPPATRWPSRRSPGPGSRPIGSDACTCSGRTSRTSASTSRRTLDRKIAALAAHASQIREPDKLAERIRSLGRRGGRADRVAGGRGPPADRDRRGRGRRPGSGSRGARPTRDARRRAGAAAVEA